MVSFRKRLTNSFVALILVLQASGRGALLPTQIARAADTSFKVPTSTHSDSDWDTNTIANVQSSDDVYASDNDDQEQDWSNFGFPAIPAGSTIDGVEVRIEAKSSDTSSCDLGMRVSWNNGPSNISTTVDDLTGTDSVLVFGGPNSTFGRTWTANDFTDANFVLKTSGLDPGNNCTDSATTYIDHIQAKVYYTVPTFADLKVTKTNNVAGNVVIGGSFVWNMFVENIGNASAVFTNDQILVDQLPTNANYSTPSYILGGGSTGNVNCSINSDTLTCEDGSGDVTIPAGGTLSVSVTVTPEDLGNLTNPRNQGTCKVDPEGRVTESNEGNNFCNANTVNVTITPSLPNPSLGESCGLDIALVLDNSGSIDSGELASMKSAMTAFTAAFAGTPTQFSVTKFATTGTVVQSFTANITDVNSAINAIPEDEGSTNWEDGLLKAQSTFDPRSNQNLVVFASDGNPNRVDNGTSVGETQAVNEAVIVANSIKSVTDARIIALGIGNGLDSANLEAISSADAVITSDFSGLAQTLADLASELCGGTITVSKLIDADGNLNTTDDQTPASGWEFDVNGTPSNPSAVVTNDVGQTPAVEVDPGTYSVAETVKPGYAVIDVDCTINRQTAGSWQSGNTITGLNVNATDIVSCRFINTTLAEVTVNKEVKSGSANANDFSLYVGGTLVTNGQASTTFSAGTYKITETDLGGTYKRTGYSGDCYIGQDTFLYIDISLGDSVDCTLENDKLPTLKLVKTVTNNNGGTAEASDFQATINGNNVDWSTPVILDDKGSYQVGESSLDGYANGVWGGDCDEAGKVYVDYAENAVCTITNDDKAPKVKVYKEINGDQCNVYDFTAEYAQGDDSEVVNEFSLLGGKGCDQEASNYYYFYPNAGEVTISEESSEGWNTDIYCYDNHENVLFDDRASLVSFDATLGDTVYCYFTNTEKATITVTKYEDKNKNGKWDDGESALSGWDIQATLTPNDDSESDAVVKQGTTGVDGTVTFNVLDEFDDAEEFDLAVSETLKAGWEQTDVTCEIVDPRYPVIDWDLSREVLPQLLIIEEDDIDTTIEPGSTAECVVGNYKTPVTIVETAVDPPKLEKTGTNASYSLYASGLIILIAVGLGLSRRKEDI